MTPDDWPVKAELNPLSSDFGKIRIGNRRYDVMAGLAQSVTLLARILTNSTKSTRTGEVRSLSDKDNDFGSRNIADVFLTFMRGKADPAIGAFVNSRVGTDVTGQEVTKLSLLDDLVTPMAAGDTVKALIDLGIPLGTAEGLVAMLGVGVNVYDDPIRKKPKKKPKKKKSKKRLPTKAR